MLAWGAVVSPAFRARVRAMGNFLVVDPSHLMACMAFETGETFHPAVRNAVGSGAVGLIQFMPATAQALGTTSEALARMSAVEQMNYVERYFAPRRGKLRTLEDVYMAILWPAAVGKPSGHVLFDRKDPKYPRRYVQNAGLDLDKDGRITKAEAGAKVRRKLEKGLLPEYASA